MQLPPDFVALMRRQHPDVAEALVEGFAAEPVCSLRVNTRKWKAAVPPQYEPVPWCAEGYYLPSRPQFTFDPLLHAGAYYVQEASSMYLDAVLRRHLESEPLMALDLCAAPGGKTTIALARLPQGSRLIANEPMRARAQVLGETVAKWGADACLVTQCFPHEFGHMRDTFDLIIADAPCSGEGMFRKDARAAQEWSIGAVGECQQRQRQILADIWPCLRPGGLLAYSTCTLNRYEDEDNARWICTELGAELLEERRFIPGIDRGEGFYIAALRKAGERPTHSCPPADVRVVGLRKVEVCSPEHLRLLSPSDGLPDAPRLALSYDEALAYLRRDALHLAVPRGIVALTYAGLPLGLAKSVGTRLNNLYPAEWRIRTTYGPDAEVRVL